jgi:hypothetical protein
LIDATLDSIGITTLLTGVRMPRMNAITERWGEDAPDRAAESHADLELPRPLEPAQIYRPRIRRRDRLGGILNE